jgi:hypothetical protein
MLNNEVEHADREERVIAKWREEMDRLLDLLHFEDSDCGEKHKQSLGKMSSDSGTWLLEALQQQDWRGVDSGSLFWLHGKRK